MDGCQRNRETETSIRIATYSDITHTHKNERSGGTLVNIDQLKKKNMRRNKVVVGDRGRGCPEGSLFNSY